MLARIAIALVALGGLSAFSGCTTVGDEDWTNSAFGNGSSGLKNNGTNAYGNFSVDVAGTTSTPGLSAVYTGFYDMVGIENISVTKTCASAGFKTDRNVTTGGLITLTGNFSANTFTGDIGTLAVNGTISGTTLGGSGRV